MKLDSWLDMITKAIVSAYVLWLRLLIFSGYAEAVYLKAWDPAWNQDRERASLWQHPLTAHRHVALQKVHRKVLWQLPWFELGPDGFVALINPLEEPFREPTRFVNAPAVFHIQEDPWLQDIESRRFWEE